MRLTERAQQVLGLAQREAQKAGEPAVGTEHLLLGLMVEGQGVAAKALQTMGVDQKKIREEIIKLVGGGESRTDFTGSGAQNIVLTPRAKKVLELSGDEARRMGVNYIGTEHILLASSGREKVWLRAC